MNSADLDIIVAEDNMVQRTYICRLIEGLGYGTIPAEDGSQALDALRTSDAQIVIADYHMPHTNGLELTRQIRGQQLDHYVHIILITGDEKDDVRTLALEAGADDFISKSSDPTALRVRVRSAARLTHHARQLAEQHQMLQEVNNRINADLKAGANAQRALLPAISREIL